MVQVQPYAAPRSGGLWEDVRAQIKSSINQSGGLVEEAEGPFGPELRAQVKASDGTGGLQPARFTGIEGPRWFLRAVFLGAAAREGAAATALEDMVRSLVVVRGGEAMPVGRAHPAGPSADRDAPSRTPRPREPTLPSPFAAWTGDHRDALAGLACRHDDHPVRRRLSAASGIAGTGARRRSRPRSCRISCAAPTTWR